MILQRGVDLPVWGWSKPGTLVTVEFSGQKGTAAAGADGRWTVKLKLLMASAEAADLIMSDGEGRRVALKNVLMGEVWHASGQSNMEWFVGKSLCTRLAQELAKAKDEVPIQELRTDTMSALYPRQKGTWRRDGRRAARQAISRRWCSLLLVNCTGS